MVGRGELTDTMWERIAPFLPRNGQRGKQWQDHRRVINGTLWKFRTGAPWRDLSPHYGPCQTCYDRRALEKNDRAREFFAKLDSRNRYAILYQIQDAKRPETRARRIEKYVAMLSEQKKLYP